MKVGGMERTVSTLILDQARDRRHPNHHKLTTPSPRSASPTTTEQITGLQKALPGSTTYLVNHPRALLLKLSSDPNATSVIPFQTQHPIQSTQAHPSPDQDLLTFLLPWLLKASASLEAALLVNPPPPSGANGAADDATQLGRNRHALRTSIESLVVKPVLTLAENGVRLEWSAGASGQITAGGVGKARQLVDALFGLVRSEYSPVRRRL